MATMAKPGLLMSVRKEWRTSPTKFMKSYFIRVPAVDRSFVIFLGNLRGRVPVLYSVEHMASREYLGEFEQIVLLALLRLGRNAYGVPVRREIEYRTKRAVSVGALYSTLDRLEAKGYVA